LWIAKSKISASQNNLAAGIDPVRELKIPFPTRLSKTGTHLIYPSSKKVSNGVDPVRESRLIKKDYISWTKPESTPN
jgi:hypothetical protein